MKEFKKLKIWQYSMEIITDTYAFVIDFPGSEKYNLASQLTRAAISISSNIAEGSSRSSDRDYARFIEIALGSCFETETQVLVALNLHFGRQDIGNKLIAKLESLRRMLIKFLNSLRKSP